MIEYPIGRSGQTLVFTASVVEKLTKHRQLRFWQCEAGGQLFGHLEGTRIQIAEATGPRKMDQRTRRSYTPDRRAEQREIDERFERGLHFIGDWHSHPEEMPIPSERDIAGLDETVRKSSHSMNGLVLVIVGQAPAPVGFHVSVSQGTGSLHRLTLDPSHGGDSVAISRSLKYGRDD